MPPLQYGEGSVLPADDVRAALGDIYAQSGRFQLGAIDDAVRCGDSDGDGLPQLLGGSVNILIGP